MRQRGLIVILYCVASLVADATDLQQMRTWRSREGQSIQAKVIELSIEDKTVHMRRSDGVAFTLPWARFGEADQTRLIEAAAKQAANSATEKTPTPEPIELPKKLKLKGVPMVVQKGNFCVPASAAMIAGYHDIKTDQDQVAELSSEMSASHQGTYPSDMLLAMEKLGFNGRSLIWKNAEEFHQIALPQIRQALVNTGPIYISFKKGVFGNMGHGCVITGYHDRREEMYFHNPWGSEFERDYTDVATEGYGVVFIDPPAPAPIASDAFIERIQQIVPRFEGHFLQLTGQLQQAKQSHELTWCSRRDSRSDQSFARNTARDDGRKILELAFERNPAVIIPFSQDGTTQAYYFVTRPPEGGARFMVHTINEQGWGPAELMTLGRLTRHWVTRFEIEGNDEKVWELPMIELHPEPTS